MASPALRISDLLKGIKIENEACMNVCEDLPDNDLEPVCMMFSRYKKGFQFYVNMCHARRAICKENLLLHVVHPSRCLMSNQYFLPIV
ncbi:hypothetical protein B5X24_HaOG201559 [Helicoverpa armigera]|nr:hypothetical protein B5X24_HaOG201559 [Helicoverpa armigera]